MALPHGARLGPYEILGPLGAGGMGEVYRARDIRLNRDVAIKVLPDSLAADPERLGRLRREAQMLAAVNHPNIAQIHGFEDADGTHALVMEFVDGPTLAERIREGRMPLAEALRAARQIGEALVAAHAQGIVHRDLKPANVKVREDGTVKVLDFGLAKIAEPASSGVGTGNMLPTVTTPAMTMAGVILGTAAYMSPEQAKGRPADKRSDVWAFGALLYEMLTGVRAFEGDDVSDTLASVLKSDPNWSALPPDVPPSITKLIQRCLTKDRQLRTIDMSVALFVMTDDAMLAPASGATSGAMVPPRPASWGRVTLAAASAAALTAAIAVIAWLATRVAPGVAPVTRFALPQTGPTALTIDQQSRDLTITPDGSLIVYKGGPPASNRLFIRPLDQLEVSALTPPGMPRAPFSSPDGQWIGFVDPGPVTLRKVARTGGPVLLICPLDGASRGATWGEDGRIIFATATSATGLQRVSSVGGQPEVLTTPDSQRGERDHLYPQWLPGGRGVLFTIVLATGGIDASQIALLDIRNPTAPPKILVRGGSQAQYVSSGHLVYAAGGSLRAIAFDLDRMEVIGTAVPVVSQITTLPTGTAEFDVGRDGTLVYVSGGTIGAPSRTLIWVDRAGREEPVPAPNRAYMSPRISPDGKRVALEIRDQDNDIWTWDFARTTLTKVTTHPELDQGPVWMPDNRFVVFSSLADGAIGGLMKQAADGSSRAELVTKTQTIMRPSAVLPDGRILVTELRGSTSGDIMVLSNTDRTLSPLIETTATDRNAEISPNGRWIAYESDDAKQFQVYVSPFPEVNKGRFQISTRGGRQPAWSRSGEELFYLAEDGVLMKFDAGLGDTWPTGTPSKLLDGKYYRGTAYARTYDVSLDGKRFLMIKNADDPAQSVLPTTIVVVRNWSEELKRLVPRPR